MSAERADSNGGAHSDTSSSRPSSTGSGMPGTAIRARSAARVTSVAMSTRCRGSRSARVDSTGPPISHGKWLMAKVSADSSGEFVRWKTSTVSAMRASSSPAVDSRNVPNSGRNSRTAKTSR
jgi:hypothetical protein